MAFAMSIAGLSFAFSKGWSFSLIILAAFPVIGIATMILMNIL